MSAGAACCNNPEPMANANRLMHFHGERLTSASALDRCTAAGKYLCNFTSQWPNTMEPSWGPMGCTLNAQVHADGQVSVVHDLPGTTRFGEAPELLDGFELDGGGSRFRVAWDTAFPSVGGDACGGCEVHGDSCVCSAATTTAAVFDAVPTTAAEVLAELRVGAADPARFPGAYTACASAACEAAAAEVTVHFAADGAEFGEDTVFEVADGFASGASTFRLNVRSTVAFPGGASLRNPVSFMSRLEPTVRDAEYETDAVLEYYLRHANTPPHVAKSLIKRFVSSNPSPGYVKRVAAAFKAGVYEDFGTGAYGDLAATVAAVLLDREADSATLDADPAHGAAREPLLKVLHFMRAMEIEAAPGMEQIDLNGVGDGIGQMAYESPTVFNFFSADFAPYGKVSEAGLVAPETELSTGPFINGLRKCSAQAPPRRCRASAPLFSALRRCAAAPPPANNPSVPQSTVCSPSSSTA